MTEIRLHSLFPCFYHTFYPAKHDSAHSFQFYIRTPVFPTWAEMIPTPRKHYPMPDQHIHDSCLILPQGCSSLLRQGSRLKNWLWSCWTDQADEGARSASRECRNACWPQAWRHSPCSSGEHHPAGRAGAITAQYHIGRIPNPTAWQSGRAAKLQCFELLP